MPSRTDIPVGSVREHLPSTMSQQSLGSAPMPGYPLDQYTVAPSPPSTVLAKGVRTLVPLIPQASAGGASFSDFATSRISTDGSRVVPGSATERLWMRVSLKVVVNPSDTTLTNVVAGLTATVSGVTGVDLRLTQQQMVNLELDVGDAATPNVIFGDSATISYLPQTISMVCPLFGGAPFLANGARVYARSTTSGLMVTDVRTLLRQSRA